MAPGWRARSCWAAGWRPGRRSNSAAWRVAQAREIARAEGLPAFTCVQHQHTYLRPRPDRPLPESATTRTARGVSSVGQLDECLGALDLVLDDELRQRLDDTALPAATNRLPRAYDSKSMRWR